MKKEATKEQLIDYLKREKGYLNITAIGVAIGCGKLLAIVQGNLRGNGYPNTLPDKYLPALRDWVKNHQCV